MKLKSIPIVTESKSSCNTLNHDQNPLVSRVDLSTPRPLRICFPILLEGDLVMSTEHLGPAYLTAVLRSQKAECKIVEVVVKEDMEKVVQNIAAWEPDIVGLSLTTIGVKQAVRFGEKLRHYLKKDCFILAGGPLATHHAEKLLHIPEWNFLDGLIRGEGEVPLLRFSEAYHTDRDYTHVPNLIYREEGAIKSNIMIAGLSDLEIIPEPARDQFEMHNGKLAYLRISTSRGCTSHCTFCNAPHAKNRVGPAVKGWRGVGPQKVIDEVERLYKKYNFNTFDFVDSTFEDPGGRPKAKERIAEIANEILKRNLHIYYNVCMQACNWHEEDRPLINLLWRSGLEKVLVGIESGSEEGLKRWQKRSTVEDNKRVIRLLREANIYVAFGFISFHPWITFNEINENTRFLHENMGHNLRRYTVRLELYPGSEVIEQLRQDNLLHSNYELSLNPFAYNYQDERIKHLAAALNGLYGKEYQEDCTIKKEPSVFEFETFDIVLHTYFSRLYRLFGGNPVAKEILDSCDHEINGLKREIANFNYNLVHHYIDLAKEDNIGKLHTEDHSETVENYYSSMLKKLKSIEMRAGLKLHRAKFNIKEIQLKAV